jgi:hypothetical protein
LLRIRDGCAAQADNPNLPPKRDASIAAPPHAADSMTTPKTSRTTGSADWEK